MAHTTRDLRNDLNTIDEILERYFWVDDIGANWRYVRESDVLDALDGVYLLKKVLLSELQQREETALSRLMQADKVSKLLTWTGV